MRLVGSEQVVQGAWGGGDRFGEGLQMLVERWNKCIEIDRDCVEKLWKYESDQVNVNKIIMKKIIVAF